MLYSFVETLSSPELDNVEDEPFNANLAEMALSILFSNDVADLTDNQTVFDIFHSPTDSYAQKLMHLVRFGEFIKSNWCYRFAAHPSFGYGAYNITRNDY